jgi:23S rRNA pseudouridine2605 synthase
LNPRNEETADRGLRLQLFISRSGRASRRAAEKLIAEGRVRVNGAVVSELGSRCLETDSVEVDGERLSLEAKAVHILLHKPAGYICSSYDPEGRPLALDLVQGDFRERLYGVGRLDQYSSGLIIFTNDGPFARDLSHPSSLIPKEYRVKTEGPIPDELAASFSGGLRVGDVAYSAESFTLLAPDMASVVLIEGKNREIRRVFESYGIRILALERIRIGDLRIGSLGVGRYRVLTAEEVAGLETMCAKKAVRHS